MRHVFLLAVLVLASPAAAQKKQKSVVVDAPPAMVKLINAGLAKKYTVVPAAQPLADLPTTKDIRQACAASGAVGVVVVKPVLGGFNVQVLSAFDGTPLDSFSMNGPPKKKPFKALPKPALTQLLGALQEAKPAPATDAPTPAPVPPKTEPVPQVAPQPVAEAPKPTPKAEPTPAPVPQPAPVETPAAAPAGLVERAEEASPPGTPSELPTVRLGVGFRGFSRTLSWTGSPSEALAGYSLTFAPAVAVSAAIFPAAPFTNGFVSNLGVSVQGDFGVGVSSKVDTTRFSTRADSLRLNAALRLPLNRTFEVDLTAGYQRQTFSIWATSPDGYARPNIPSVLSNAVRATAGLRLNKLGPVSIDALGGFALMVGLGELSSTGFFPRASAFAVDASLGASVSVAEHLDLRLAADWQRAFITLRPEDGANLFARGAADQSIGGTLAVVWVM